MKRKILVAAALPYANGSLHLGHVAGLIGSDVLARYFRLKGNSVLYVSGSDCYGTPIVFEAEKKNIHPSKIADKYHQEFVDVLINGLNFSYDFFTKTTSPAHSETVQEIFLNLYKKGLIYKKTEDLPYCEKCKKFLPDRYIEGECYLCNFDSARGDQCDGCGNLMETKRIIDSKCKICKNPPLWRESEHFFLKLSSFEKELKSWVKNSSGWRTNAKNFTLQLLNEGLRDRSITRDTGWGISIPLKGYETKRIYVWFEAVCAYLSASKEWAKLKNERWEDFWKDENNLHYYIHGKDNIPFHSIIWPAILLGNEKLHLPDRIISSEYLTLEKKQFSKSRNWAIWVQDFLKKFDSETLRYYLIINGSETSDADFSWKEFYAKTNNELIANFGNFVYRTTSFVQKNFKDGVNGQRLNDKKSLDFLSLTEETFSLTGEAIENGQFRKALQNIFKLVEHGNRYIDKSKPWKTIKDSPKKTENDLFLLLHSIKCLAILVNPFLPKTSKEICKQLSIDYSKIKWEPPILEKIKIEEISPLFEKIEEKNIEKETLNLKKHSR
jgi:methionyl-tRNA synthetase